MGAKKETDIEDLYKNSKISYEEKHYFTLEDIGTSLVYGLQMTINHKDGRQSLKESPENVPQKLEIKHWKCVQGSVRFVLNHEKDEYIIIIKQQIDKYDETSTVPAKQIPITDSGLVNMVSETWHKSKYYWTSVVEIISSQPFKDSALIDKLFIALHKDNSHYLGPYEMHIS